jgi:RNA polymerase sigma-70 factor (ECF subfamily)
LLRRLAVYRALDRLRQKQSRISVDELELESHAPGPAEAAIARELEGRLREAVAKLPAREAEVFWLRYFEDLSNRDIAELLAISPGAVGAALCKARTKLQALILESHRGIEG